MKKLGLIVGLGPETTIEYYRGIVYGAQKKLKKDFVIPMTMENLSTFTVMELAGAGRFSEMEDYLVSGIEVLARAGAEVGAIACNTGHLVFDAVQKRAAIPLVSIVKATCDRVRTRGFKKVALFGTVATMKSTLYTKPLKESGIDVVLPNCEEMELIGRRIDTELEKGLVRKETTQELLQIADRLKNEEGAEALILGCTELPMAFKEVDAPMPIVNTIDVHVEAILTALLDE